MVVIGSGGQWIIRLCQLGQIYWRVGVKGGGLHDQFVDGLWLPYKYK